MAPYAKPTRSKKKKNDTPPPSEVVMTPKEDKAKPERTIPSNVYFNPVINNKRDVLRPEELQADQQACLRVVCESCNQPIIPQLASIEKHNLETSSVEINKLLEKIKALNAASVPGDDKKDWKKTYNSISTKTSEVLKSCQSQIDLLGKIANSVKIAKTPIHDSVDLLGSPYLSIDPAFMTPEEIDKLTAETKKLVFKQEGGRLVYYAGEFSHTYSNLPHVAQPIPDFLEAIIDKLPVPEGHQRPNAVICNRYQDGKSTMGAHPDNEPDLCPWGNIYGLSGGETRTLKFTKKDAPEQSFKLVSGSLNIMSRSLQNLYKHEIIQETGLVGERINWTFRHINPAFIESSTLILADSQCHGVKFGSERQTLGSHCPGQRVNTYKVEHLLLEDSAFIASFKNVVISLGINNLRSHRSKITNPQEISDLIQRKCEEILKLNPSCRIGISTVLPTKDVELNKKVSEFNRLLAIVILKLSGKSNAVSLIDLSFMSSRTDGCLKDAFWKSGDDKIHVNDIGTKVIGCRLKRFIRDIPLYRFLRKKKSRSMLETK